MEAMEGAERLGFKGICSRAWDDPSSASIEKESFIMQATVEGLYRRDEEKLMGEEKQGNDVLDLLMLSDVIQ